ncbi:DNA topoisomerase III [Caldalkalibacillus salinus]|uniref:DNA topoisomerase III n=1 Tax=Caldalkalibacillus salinus TaxID=2803787 RepID=UPI0019208927|nr:DNA topoisomerase III [Caldalkalibacillus salinus]
MAKTLVLAEKPSVGRDIARVLQCTKKLNGYFEGQQYIVTWALGHLVTLAGPESYGEKYKSWKLEDLPMLFPTLKLEVIKQSSKQFHTVKKLMHRKDVSQIVIATDAGREGELVARWIIEKANVKKQLKRLWISSVTDKAIKDGFKNLKNGHAYDNLYASAVARSEADWYVGLNATRALTCKHNAQLSCGRVQTPTLAIIAKREEEIRHFKPQTYYGLKASLNKGLHLHWQSEGGQHKTFNKTTADELLQKVKDEKTAKVIDLKQTHKKSYAPQLYDLTELQRDANKFFGFSAKETLSIMQKLYEQHKVLTYPRTDSRYLSSDIMPTLKDRIKACRVGPYTNIAAKALKMPLKLSKHYVDDRKVTDHHAIIPTEQAVLLQDLNQKERKIYDLVIKRFLSVLFPPFEYEQTTVQTAIAGETFVAKGKVVRAKGWKEVTEHQDHDDEQTDDVQDQQLPQLTKGDTLNVVSVTQTKGETKPPAPFNEATLLSAMENPVKYMSGEDRAAKDTLGKTGGLGTVATRADIIEKLFSSFAIEQRGKGIHLTPKGKQLLELVPEELKSPALTADWEQKLERISKGQLPKDNFLQEMKAYAKSVVQEIKNSEKTYKHHNLTGSRCPDCGKFMLEVKNKKGKMLVCQDRECGRRKNVAKQTKARCPQCRKTLELRGEGEGQIFACQCGFREKLSTFNKRREQDKQRKASKKDVQQYMKKQKHDDEPFNPALADALSKLNLDQED